MQAHHAVAHKAVWVTYRFNMLALLCLGLGLGLLWGIRYLELLSHNPDAIALQKCQSYAQSHLALPTTVQFTNLQTSHVTHTDDTYTVTFAQLPSQQPPQQQGYACTARYVNEKWKVLNVVPTAARP